MPLFRIVMDNVWTTKVYRPLHFTGSLLDAEKRRLELWNQTYGHMADGSNRLTLWDGPFQQLEMTDFSEDGVEK
jgi:hypothetical protein